MTADELRSVRGELEERHPVWSPRTLHGMLDAVAAEHGNRPFVIADDRFYSYSDMVEWSRRIAAGLLASGFQPGERVALLLPNCPALVAAVFGISRAGGVA